MILILINSFGTFGAISEKEREHTVCICLFCFLLRDKYRRAWRFYGRCTLVILDCDSSKQGIAVSSHQRDTKKVHLMMSPVLVLQIDMNYDMISIQIINDFEFKGLSKATPPKFNSLP